MQRRIQSLPPQLANQIAAGEVVERPASVVKELLENSIDAGATTIDLEVEQGGAKLIRVTDDGRGIHREDLRLAIAPHATSKIYSQEELEQIASLGFRGEALASIASVSRFSLASRLEGEEQGWQVSEAGEPIPHPLPRGTCVDVRELFYNTPARRKFLRTERTEFLHIEEVVKRLALSRFDVAFTLRHNGRQILRLRKASNREQQAKRVAEVLGRGFISQAVSLEFEAAGMRLWGWLALPEASRSQADSQYFYLNGRMIRDKLITHAVRQAHQAVLEPGRHPAYALYLEVDPRQVDVNVHPTKHEVRFRESRMVHDFIFRQLRSALEAEESSIQGEAISPVENFEKQPAMGGHTSGSYPRPGMQRIAETKSFYRQASESVAESLNRAKMILHSRFLLLETAEGPQLLDLPAARTALLREHMQQMLEAGEVRSQPLLVPYSCNLQSGDIERLLAASECYSRFGFELEQLGEGSLVLRRLPSLLQGVAATRVIEALLEQSKEFVPEEQECTQLLDALIALSVAETPIVELVSANRLLQQLETLPGGGLGFTRPLTLAHLERCFEGKG